MPETIHVERLIVCAVCTSGQVVELELPEWIEAEFFELLEQQEELMIKGHAPINTGPLFN